VAAGLALAATIMIAALTLTSEPPGFGGPSFLCVLCGEHWVADTLLNVLLFLPLGIALERVGASPKRAFIISLLFSALIGFLQATVITGRDSSLRDIITNSAGGWLGAALSQSWPSLVVPPFSRRKWWALAMTILWPAVITATVWSIEPPIQDRRYFGQYAPTDTILPEFKAEIISAAFHGSALPVGAFTNQSDVLGAFRKREAWLTATVAQPPPTAGLATIIAVVDEREEEALTLSQAGSDLVGHVRLRSDELGLNSPSLRMKHALRRDGSGASIEIGGGLRGAAIVLEARRGAESHRRELALTPGTGWMLLYPFDVSLPWEPRVFGLLWMTALTLPLQYCWTLWASGGHWRAITLRGTPIVLAFLVLSIEPKRFNAASVSIFEIAGVVVGAIAGECLARIAGREQREKTAAREPLA
jgi:hypothetical protein